MYAYNVGTATNTKGSRALHVLHCLPKMWTLWQRHKDIVNLKSLCSLVHDQKIFQWVRGQYEASKSPYSAIMQTLCGIP